MARATIQPTCGLLTQVTATQADPQRITLHIESECPGIRRIADELSAVDPYDEIAARGANSRLLALGLQHCVHASCPVPVGILKAVEVTAGLDLPKPITIEITDD